MSLTTETFGNVLVAHTPDELTEDTAQLVRDTLLQAINEGQTSIVLQMDRTDCYDSVGLETLLDIQDAAREKGGNLKICGLEDPGRKILEVTRLDHRIDVFPSVIDAVSSFR